MTVVMSGHYLYHDAPSRESVLYSFRKSATVSWACESIESLFWMFWCNLVKQNWDHMMKIVFFCVLFLFNWIQMLLIGGGYGLVRCPSCICSCLTAIPLTQLLKLSEAALSLKQMRGFLSVQLHIQEQCSFILCLQRHCAKLNEDCVFRVWVWGHDCVCACVRVWIL